MIYTVIVVAVAFSILQQLRLPKRTPSVSPVTVDPAVVARVRAYCALSMVERYGAHGPP
jgi:hypothetical protein